MAGKVGMGGKATKPGQLINRGKNVWLVRV